MRTRYAILIAAGFAGVSAPALSEKAPLSMLDELDDGLWELRERDSRMPPHQLCLDNGRRLIQLRHPGANCRNVVVEDNPNEITVQYTCRGQGYGRTHVRRESNELVQIDSQGIVHGLPFSFSAEGRKVGACRG